MPTYSNTSNTTYQTKAGKFSAGATGFQTQELLDSLPGVVRTADTPYAHEPRTIAADNTMTPWVWTPSGSYVLTLGGDWSGTVTVQRAKESDGSDAVLAGEFSSDDLLLVRPLTEITGAYYRYGFLAGGLVSGGLNGNIEVG